MTDEEIISRIEAGEDSRMQFKREAIGVNDLAKELAAFNLIVPVTGKGKGTYRVFGGAAR